MFNQEHLSQIDKQYFNVIMLDGKDVTIQSRNTGHYWYLHCAGYPTEEALVIFHKHRFSHPYHQHGTGGGHLLNTLAAALKSDDMLDLVYGLKRPYRKNASFIMNDATLPSLRKLKDNNGAYIWQPAYQAGEPDRILGYKVETSAYAPKDGIAFGDYSYYNIGDRGNRSFKQLNELFAGNGMIGFVAKERVDGKLVLPEAVQIMKLKAD